MTERVRTLPPAIRPSPPCGRGVGPLSTRDVPWVESTAGLVAGVAVALTFQNTVLGLISGMFVEVAYSLLSRATPMVSVQNVFTAATFGFPLWTVLNTIVIPAASGRNPQWSAEDMRVLLPGLVGWIAYGAIHPSGDRVTAHIQATGAEVYLHGGASKWQSGAVGCRLGPFLLGLSL